MRLSFIEAPAKKYDRLLVRALGASIGGDADFVCVIGVKNAELIAELKAAGRPFLYFDKGYNRQWPQWWRVSVNGHQPTRYLSRLGFDGRRAAVQGWHPAPWRAQGKHILYAASGVKYHRMHGLDDPSDYARDLVYRLRKITNRKIIYRPKPSWKEAEPIDGTDFVNRARYPIALDLRNAHAMITHGSGASIEALLAGVPAIVLGDAVTQSISSTSIEDIERPKKATLAERKQLLANIAHCQWSLDEIAGGHMRKSLEMMIAAENLG